MGDQIGLVFTKVLNELGRGLEEEEEREESVDRPDWEKSVGKDILGMADRIFGMVRQLDPQLQLQYKKTHLAVGKNGSTDRFVTLKPKQQFMRLEVWVPQAEEIDQQLREAGLDVMSYRYGKYRIRLTQADLVSKEKPLMDLLRLGFENRELA